jgi:phage-related protein
MEAHDKDLVWLHGDVKTPPFSAEARTEAGVLLRKLQMGQKLTMPQSEPLRAVGPGCHELRVRDEKANWRIMYCIEPDAIVIVEGFDKKTGAVPQKIVEICKRRLKAYRAMAAPD